MQKVISSNLKVPLNGQSYNFLGSTYIGLRTARYLMMYQQRKAIHTCLNIIYEEHTILDKENKDHCHINRLKAIIKKVIINAH